jgi:hypothetical protein
MPPRGILTHDCSRRAAVDLSLRPRDYWDRQVDGYTDIIILLNEDSKPRANTVVENTVRRCRGLLCVSQTRYAQDKFDRYDSCDQNISQGVFCVSPLTNLENVTHTRHDWYNSHFDSKHQTEVDVVLNGKANTGSLGRDFVLPTI